MIFHLFDLVLKLLFSSLHLVHPLSEVKVGGVRLDLEVVVGLLNQVVDGLAQVLCLGHLALSFGLVLDRVVLPRVRLDTPANPLYVRPPMYLAILHIQDIFE